MKQSIVADTADVFYYEAAAKVNKSKFSGWVREKVSFYEIQFM